ncbi:10178_t:CDS:1, partial [Funneliformis caledonium]
PFASVPGVTTCLRFFRDEPQNNCFQLFSNISGLSDWIWMMLVLLERAEPTEASYK